MIDLEDRLRSIAVEVRPPDLAAIRTRIVRHRRRRRVLASTGGGVLVIGLLVGMVALRSSPDRSPAQSIEPVSTAPQVVDSTDPLASRTQLAQPLSFGSSGPEVRGLQQRLSDLGFKPGPVDGSFGSDTQQAVWAFEKLTSSVPYDEVTGTVTNETWQMMQDDLAVQPRRQVRGTHVEIYLPRQLLIVFADDEPVLITHISSGELNADGEPVTFCETLRFDTDDQGNALDVPIERGMCAEAKTPGGVFHIARRVAGNRIGELGGMWNPVYFNYGISVYGAHNVPAEPVSHGGVRIPISVADTFPDLVDDGDLVYVWGWDGKEPEDYTRAESLPSFNRRDPSTTG